MSFERPTLATLIERVQADAESRIGKKQMRWSVVTVLCRVIAGVAHGLYGFIQFVLRQCFSSTAEGVYLERRASEYGIYRRKASKAVGTVTFTGTATVPEGTQLENEQGTTYNTTADSVDGVASIEAAVGGKAGNSEEGMTLTLVSPISGVMSTATASALAGGVDVEEDESLRERLIYRQKNPPRAGTKEDFISWAKEISGVTRAWCYPHEMGIGSVTVRFMTDGLTENGIPDETMIARVRANIEEQMPVTTILYVCAPNTKPLDLTIDITPDTDEIRQEIQLAIESMILTETSPGSSILLTSILRAVNSVSQLEDFRVVSPTDDVKTETGQVFIPGTITWV